MDYMLVVLFFVNGPSQPPVFVDGWMPIQFDSYQECEARREFTQEQFDMQGGIPPYILACYEKQAPGEAI